MGTRNLTVVYKDGEPKVAQYCQWDGYPSGQGVTVLDFLKTNDLNLFAKKVGQCTWLSDEELYDLWKSVGADDTGFVSMEISNKFRKRFPHLHRDTGARILGLIQDSDGLQLVNSIGFAADGLFCEWAYVIDLDAQTLEVYSGFHKGPVVGRFKDMETEGEYSPISLEKTYALTDLPYQAKFLTDLSSNTPCLGTTLSRFSTGGPGTLTGPGESK